MRRPVLLAFAALLGLCAMLVACRPETRSPYEPTYSAQPSAGTAAIYVLAVHPLHSPKRLFEVYQPLVDYLNARLPGATIRLEASADYAAFEKKLAQREVELALPNPYQTVESLAFGYRVFAKMGDDDKFRGVLLVRRNSGINSAHDLVGKAVSYPAPTALAATLMTQWLLHEQGIDVMRDIDNRYVGTQESSIMNVSLGLTAAGSTWMSPWATFQREHPDLAAKLEARWRTPSLPNNALVARDDVPQAVVDRIAGLLVALQKDDEGRTILARMELSSFELASSERYQPVRDFINRFEREVRPIKAPAPVKGRG